MTRLLFFFISFSAIANTKNVIIVGEPQRLSALQFCGIQINPKSNVHQLKLTQNELLCLNSMKNDSEIIDDEEIKLSKQPKFKLDQRVSFMAGKSIGANKFKKLHPNWDGRNVITGVIDDGISPHQAGFISTTTGERKLIKGFLTQQLTPLISLSIKWLINGLVILMRLFMR